MANPGLGFSCSCGGVGGKNDAGRSGWLLAFEAKSVIGSFISWTPLPDEELAVGLFGFEQDDDKEVAENEFFLLLLGFATNSDATITSPVLASNLTSFFSDCSSENPRGFNRILLHSSSAHHLIC